MCHVRIGATRRSSMESTGHQSQIPRLQPQFGQYHPQFHQILGTQNPNSFDSLPQPQLTACYFRHPTATSHDPYVPIASAADARNSAAVQQCGLDPNAYAGTLVTLPADCEAYSGNPYLYSGIASYPFPVINPPGNVTKKKQSKKPKVVQYFCCGICNIHCTSKDLLDQHKLGRKHKKNLERLKDPNASASSATAQLNLPLIGPQPYPNQQNADIASQKNRKKATCDTLENLEIKRRKVVDCGADAGAIRMCTICNVVCNSETVFRFHLVGQKHAAALRKYADSSLGTVVS